MEKTQIQKYKNIINIKIFLIIVILVVVGSAVIYQSHVIKNEIPDDPASAQTGIDETIQEDVRDFPADINENENKIISYGYQVPSLNLNVLVKLLSNSFVAVRQSDSSDEFVGVSDLVTNTDLQSLIIDTQNKLHYNDSVKIILYKDNGDGIFDPASDLPLLDPAGNAVEQELFISPLD